MVERNVVASFSGQLFEAAATTKKWTSTSSANASIQIINIEDEKHQFVGLDEDREVFAHDINDDIQLRTKDNFVQWRRKDSTGKVTTYGARLKDSRESQRLEGIVGGILAMLETIPSAVPWQTDSKPQANEKPIKKHLGNDVLLKVHLPGKQTTVITVPPSITMEELLSLIVTKRRLDHRFYELALPPSKPKSMQAQLLPSTAFHTLNITEIHVIKRSKPITSKMHQAPPPTGQTKQESSPNQKSMTLPGRHRKISQPLPFESTKPSLNQKQAVPPSTEKQTPMTILTVHLPYDQRTVIKVSPAMTMPQLLMYICEKRNLNPAHHSLVLPSPTSGQMRMVSREMTVSSLRNGVITLVDLKASTSDKPNPMILDHHISGKKGSYSPPVVKPAAVEKRAAPQLPANAIKQTSHDVVDSGEVKVAEKTDGEKSPVKHIAKRKAPPPPKGAKKDMAVPSSQSQSNAGSTTNAGDQIHLTGHTRPPGSPAKRRAPDIPTVVKQPTAGKPISKQMSDSALIKHQPPPNPLKKSMTRMMEDISKHQVAEAPSMVATKKRRPAPTRPAPTLPNSHAQHKLQSSECQRDDVMDTSTDHIASQLHQGTNRANRPGSATSAQIRLEVTELEASLADVVEEAEWHLQKTKTKQDNSVDKTDVVQAPMEFDDSQPPTRADNKTVSQPKELSPDQMVSESGTVRGIKGRVKEQIASNQSKLMLEGLMMKKQQPFARTPLSVIHKADASQTSNNETSLKRYGSQEAISNKESEDVIQRSNSLKTNQSGAKSDGKQKPRGKAPLPPQDKARTKQPQQIQPKPLDHQPTATPAVQNVTIPAESNKTLQQNTEALMKQTAPPATLPDTEKKVPPKVKPKTARTKSKEAEDNTVIAPEAPKAFHSRSSPHPSLSKRAKSESQIKRTPQGSPRIDRKSTAVIESSEDGQKVLVLSPGGGKANKDTQVRIFLPPPPPILPPCREQEAENDTRPHDTNNITTVDNATIANTEITTVTDKRTGVVTSTVTSQLQSDTIDSRPSSHREQNNKTTKSNPLQQKKKGDHLSDNDDIEVDSEMEAIEPLPQVLFHSLQDLPSTPPGTPCNELEVAEMKISESELNDDDDNHDDLDIVPPPPALDDLNIDIADGTISPLPPPDDFDPLSLPPPLSTNDDDFDIILPPPSSSTEDDIVTTTAVPPTLSTADNAIAPITAPPPSSSFLEDDIIGDTTETSLPIEDDETFQDLPITLALPEVSDEAMVAVQAGYDDDDDEIMLNLLPDDVNLSESDTELPAAMNENIVSALESTEPDTIIDAAETDKDEKSISQPDVQAEIITGELENTTSDTPVDVEPEKSVATAEVQQSQDDLSNIIASLETMLQDEPQSNEEQILDDADATSLAWVEPYGNHIPTEAPVDSSKEDTPKAILNQPPSDDLNQTVTITPKPDKGITDIKPMPVAPLPARAAPPPPPLPPIGKVKTPPAMMTSPTKTATSPTKAKSPPPAVKPKPKRPVSETLTEEFQDELAEKLKRRQQKIHDWTKDDEKPKSPTQTTPTIFPTVPSGTVQTKSAAYNTAPVKPNLHAKSIQGAAAPNAQHTSSVGTQQQMEQFQQLQNQMLQQQILQLQQQLQQLQQQIPAGGNPMMAMPQSMPQIGTGMQFPQVGTGMQFPQGANLMQAPQLSTGMQIPMQQQNAIPMHNPMQTAGDGGTLNAAGTHKLTTSMDSDNARSESPPPLPPTSPPPLDNSPNYDQVVRRGINKNASDSALQKRPSSQVLRSRVFGEYEDVLDDILEEVREVDHNTFLRKSPTPPPPIRPGAGGPHTEMASLLAEAMKQRRINITSKRLSSASVEEEPDTSHEWD